MENVMFESKVVIPENGSAIEIDANGKLLVPAGVWLTGPIELKSNINLNKLGYNEGFISINEVSNSLKISSKHN